LPPNQEKVKQKYEKYSEKLAIGISGIFILQGIPGILAQDWLDMLWLTWIVWFIYFIPEKK